MSYNVRAVRLALTNLILFLLTWYYQVPERIWSLVTVWFVMFEYTCVGGVWTKSLYRFLGTLFSSVYGLFIIYFFSNNVIINMFAFIPAIFVYTYFFMDTDKAYIGTIGCVTLSIVLLNHNDVDAAILRTFNIFLGIFAAMFMMRFFFPQYARDLLMEMQIQFIVKIETLLSGLLDTSLPFDAFKEKERTHACEILNTMSEFNARLKEASIESSTGSQLIIHHQKAIEIIYYISRLISTLVNKIVLDEVRQDLLFQKKMRQYLMMFETLKQQLIFKSIHNQTQVMTSMNDIINDQLVWDEMHTSSSSSQIKVAFFILESMQKAMNELADEIGQVVFLYQKTEDLCLRKEQDDGAHET